ncbi:MAG: hypothetical protein R3C18_18950 [Planctomycetaceae bacterium]
MHVSRMTFTLLLTAIVAMVLVQVGQVADVQPDEGPRIAKLNLSDCFEQWRKDHTIPSKYQPTGNSNTCDFDDLLNEAVSARELERWHAEDQRDFLKQLHLSLEEFCEGEGVDLVVAVDEPLPNDDLFCGIRNSLGMKVIYVRHPVDATDDVISGLSSKQ